MLDSCSWARSVLVCAWCTCDTTLEKTDFPPVVCVSCLQIASWLGVGSCVYFPLFMLNPLIWTCAGPLCFATVSVSSRVPVLLCLEDCLFGVMRHLWLLWSMIYPPPLCIDPSVFRGGAYHRLPIEDWVLQSPWSLTFILEAEKGSSLLHIGSPFSYRAILIRRGRDDNLVFLVIITLCSMSKLKVLMGFQNFEIRRQRIWKQSTAHL